MIAGLSALLITLGLGQLLTTICGLYGASLVGARRLAGLALGLGLLWAGLLLLPSTASVLGWTIAAGPLALGLLLLGGAYIAPVSPPEALFTPNHPAHGGCRRIAIADGNGRVPGLLLSPPQTVPRREAAICIVPGAGDTKTFFKWRLARALLASGFTVLTIDLPGHGDDRQRPLVYPDCLSAVPAAVRWLRAQPDIRRVGVIGISLGGAVAIRSLAEKGAALADGLVVVGTPVCLKYSPTLYYREVWNTIFRAPSLALLREMTVKQAKETWDTGGFRSRHQISELFELTNPLASVARLSTLPLLLVYSQRDSVAPPEHAHWLRQQAPQARLIESKKASHVMLTLMPEINQAIVAWLEQVLCGQD